MPSSDAAACQIAQSTTRRLIAVEELFEEIDHVLVSREVDAVPDKQRAGGMNRQ
jgi:hypothetical protein